MIKLGQYEYCGDVRLIDIDGNVWEGKALDVVDESDRSEYEKSEDGLVVNVKGALIDFYVSEIKSIEKINR